jgi:hypothetical protein
MGGGKKGGSGRMRRNGALLFLFVSSFFVDLILLVLSQISPFVPEQGIGIWIS